MGVTKDPVSGLSTGFGTVEMNSDADAQSAINRLNFSQYGGRTIGVSRARLAQVTNPIGKAGSSPSFICLPPWGTSSESESDSIGICTQFE